MLMLTYVAGSETTSSALQYILWRLGRNKKLQEDIRYDPTSSKLKDFIKACFKEYTSVPFVSRTANKDIVIRVECNSGTWEYPIAKGEVLIIAPLLAGTSIFAEENVHFCPGQWLARAEIESMILTFLKSYDIKSFPKKDKLETIPGHGFLKVEPVELELRKIR